MIASRITQVIKVMNTSILKEIKEKEQTTTTLDQKYSLLTFGKENEYELNIANDRASRESAYQLVYKSYVDRNYAKEHQSKMWYSLHDAHPDTVTFIIKKQLKIVGAMTVVFDSLLGLPCEELFPKNTQALRNKLKYIAEVVSLSIDESERGASKILTKLINTAIRYSNRIKRATDFLITVNPHHCFFYKKKLLFSELNQAKSFSKVSGAPAVLLHLDLITAKNITEEVTKNVTDKPIHHKYKRTLYPQFTPYEKEQTIFKQLDSNLATLDEKDFNYFFKENRKLFLKATQKEKEYLSEFYAHLKHNPNSTESSINKQVS